MVFRLLNLKAKTVSLTALLLAVSSFLSQFLGFFRDNLLANLFPKEITDVYFASFRVPDLVYAIIITGGITAAFLPVFAEVFKKDGAEEAKRLSSSVLTLFFICLVIISSVLFMLTPQLLKIVAPGFSAEQRSLAVILTRIMFLSPILLGLSAIFSSILQFFNIFIATALAPIFYNLGIITGIIFFSPRMGPAGLALGVVLGACLHFLIQIPPFLKSGFSLKPSFSWKIFGLKKIFTLMIPRTIGSTASVFNLIFITAVASTLSAGAISIFNFSNNIQSFPSSLIGVSFATAIFPFLSRVFADNNKEKFAKNFSAVFCHILFLIIPISVLVFLLRAQAIRLILGTYFSGSGLFGWNETRLTAASLGIFSISLFAAAIIPFLAKVFFSRHNTSTPVKIAIASIFSNMVFCLFFTRVLSFSNFFQKTAVSLLKLKGIPDISVLGLPLAYSISVILQFFLLNFYLKKAIGKFSYKEIFSCLKRVLASTFLMAISVYLCLNAYSLVFSTNTVLSVFFQAFFAGIAGIGAYFLFSSVFRVREAETIVLFLKKTINQLKTKNGTR